MNILQIANKAIYPPDGGTQAILSMSKGYIRNGHHVHLLNMTTHKHFNNFSIIEEEYQPHLEINTVEINTKINYFKLIFSLIFSKTPYIAKRFYSDKFLEVLKSLLVKGKYSFVQIEGLYVLQYIHAIKSVYDGKIVYRPHNSEYKIWKANAKVSRNLIKKLYFKILSIKLKNFERKLLNKYDYILPISEIDAVTYHSEGNIKPSLVSPYGIDVKALSHFQRDYISGKNQINYIGALDWIPNQEGIIWFLEKCLPVILNETPGLKLNIAGRNAPEWFIKKLKRKGINYVGEVENAIEFIQNPGPVIVPLFSGSGLRVKIIEAMALKKAIVTTSIGAEGINYTNNENILIADNPYEFTNSILKILNDTDFEKETGERAFNFVKKNFDFENITANIISFIK